MFDAGSPDEQTRRTAIRMLKICVSGLNEISQLWARSRRAVRSLRLLAQEWGVAIDDEVFSQQQSEESPHSSSDVPGISMPVIEDSEPEDVGIETARIQAEPRPGDEDGVGNVRADDFLIFPDSANYEPDSMMQQWPWDEYTFWDPELNPFPDDIFLR